MTSSNSSGADPERIVSVEAPDSATLLLELSSEIQVTIDVSSMLEGEVFRAVRESEDMFQSVTVGEGGASVVWPNGAEIDSQVLLGNRMPANATRAVSDDHLIRILDDHLEPTPSKLFLALLNTSWPLDDPLLLGHRREIDPDEIVELVDRWRLIANRTINRVARVVANDLLWTHRQLAKLKQPHNFATQAQREYQELSDDESLQFDDRADYLADALRLSADLKDKTALQAAATEIRSRFTSSAHQANASDATAHIAVMTKFTPIRLGDPEYEAAVKVAENQIQFHHAGVVLLRTLAQFVHLAPIKSSIDLEQLGSEVTILMNKSEGNDALTSRLSEAWLRCIGHVPELLKAARGTDLQIDWDRAAAATGSAKFGALASGERKARQWGLPSEVKRFQREIQSLDDIGGQAITTSITVPAEAIDELVVMLSCGETWMEKLSNFALAVGPITGTHDHNVQVATRSLDAQPLGRLLRSVRLGSRNVAIAESEGEDEKMVIEIAQSEASSASLYAAVLLEAVEVVAPSLDATTDEEICHFLRQRGAVDLGEERGLRVAAGIKAFFRKDFDTSAHVLLPRLEFALRERSSRFNSVINPTNGTSRGGETTLKPVLESLKGLIGEDWRRCFLNTLVHEHGLNLRNEILHGLTPEVRARDAAIICHLTLAAVLSDDLADDTAAAVTH